MELEPDQRHVVVFLTELGLTDGRVKETATPREKRSGDQVIKVEKPKGVRIVRSGTMRLSYLGQDRADIQDATKCLAQRMKDLGGYDMGELRPPSGEVLEERPQCCVEIPRAKLVPGRSSSETCPRAHQTLFGRESNSTHR